MPVKIGCKDACGIAQLMRLGWYRCIHCKSQEAPQNRTLLAGCKMLHSWYIELEMCLCELLRGYGLEVGQTNRKTFEGRVRELAASVPGFDSAMDALLKGKG